MAGSAQQSAKKAGRTAKQGARQGAQGARQGAQHRWVKVAARVGILAYGVTHALIAVLAVQIALGSSGEQADQAGAFALLSEQPWGRALLWVLVVGFVAVVLWRAQQAIWGYAYVSDTGKQLRERVVSGAKAVVFAVLAVLAAQVAMGGGAGGGGGQQSATAGVLGLPGGRFLVGAVGLGIVAVGVYKMVEGWQQKFQEDMDLPSDRRARDLALRSGQIGFIAKGVSVGLIGALVVTAAVRADPQQSGGMDQALKSLAGQPYGPYLLLAVAVGLLAYAVFCAFDARYHRV